MSVEPALEAKGLLLLDHLLMLLKELSCFKDAVIGSVHCVTRPTTKYISKQL